jgi:CubicO group peptidase (beta-lactamase class C family)
LTATAGRCDPAFQPVRDAFERCFAELGEIGAAVCLVVDGQVVVDLWGGHADAARQRPWAADTLAEVYSVGKPIVATLLLQLVDDGVVGLDDRIAAHWPAFGAAGKEEATIRHALCHRAGVPAIRERLADDDLWDFERMAGALAATAPWWAPGARHGYHTNTYGHLVGGLLLAVTGELPGTLLRRRVADPLDADIHFGVSAGDLPRCADVVWDGPDLALGFDDIVALGDDDAMNLLGYANPPGYSSMGVVNTDRWRRAQVPSTNGHATARGVAAFYQGLLDGALLSADLLAESTRAQSSGWCPTLGQDVTFGLGFQPWTEGRPIGRSPAAFGHFGTGGSLGFADPAHGIAFGYVMNHTIPRWQSPRNRALVDAAYATVTGPG